MADDNRENLNAVEEELRSLTPQATTINRDRMLWLAGRASLQSELKTSRLRVIWPIVNCLSSVAAGMLLAFLILTATSNSPAVVSQSETRTTSQPAHDAVLVQGSNRVVEAPSLPIPPAGLLHSFPPSMLSDNASYLELRSSILAYGADALPYRLPAVFYQSRSETNTELPTQQNLLREMLNNDGRGRSSQQAG